LPESELWHQQGVISQKAESSLLGGPANL